MINETLQSYITVLPHIKDYLKQDIMIGLTDGEKFVGFWPGDKMSAPVQIGDSLKADDPMIESFRTGRTIDMTLPPDIHGFPFRSITSPIKDSNNKIVGTIGIGLSLESKQNAEDIETEVMKSIEDSKSELEKIQKISDYVSEESDFLRNSFKDIIQKTDDINNATKNIKEIAFQTNILSLNASIQSSHAGEFGQGFSVVAKEMRNLANSSKESSDNILNNINNLFSEVNDINAKLSSLFEIIKSQKDLVEKITDSASNVGKLTEEVIDIIRNS